MKVMTTVGCGSLNMYYYRTSVYHDVDELAFFGAVNISLYNLVRLVIYSGTPL